MHVGMQPSKSIFEQLYYIQTLETATLFSYSNIPLLILKTFNRIYSTLLSTAAVNSKSLEMQEIEMMLLTTLSFYNYFIKQIHLSHQPLTQPTPKSPSFKPQL
jgi:hypothetical protein